MLIDAVAQRVVDRLFESIDHHVSIMNVKGRVIASSEVECIGSFHEAAFRMIEESIPIMEVSEGERYAGTFPGIYMIFRVKKKVAGVVGVIGNPDTVRPLAPLLRTSVESLLESEAQIDSMENVNRKGHFFQKMIYDEKRDAALLEGLALELGYNTERTRISIYIDVQEEGVREEVYRRCLAEGSSADDMIIRLKSGNTLIMLPIDEDALQYTDYRSMVELYLEPVKAYLERTRIRYDFLVGSMQIKLILYREAYEHSRWLKHLGGYSNSLLFFYDHLEEYLFSQIPPMVVRNALDAFMGLYRQEFWEEYQTIVSSMIHNNNNMVRASTDLHMHKNTLAYKYNRIRETLSINPLEKSEDDQFARQLIFYLRQKS